MYWNSGGSRKKHRLQWKTYMGVCMCVCVYEKKPLNLKLTTSVDWLGKKKIREGKNCREIKLLDITENKQPSTNMKVPLVFLIWPRPLWSSRWKPLVYTPMQCSEDVWDPCDHFYQSWALRPPSTRLVRRQRLLRGSCRFRMGMWPGMGMGCVNPSGVPGMVLCPFGHCVGKAQGKLDWAKTLLQDRIHRLWLLVFVDVTLWCDSLLCHHLEILLKEIVTLRQTYDNEEAFNTGSKYIKISHINISHLQLLVIYRITTTFMKIYIP